MTARSGDNCALHNSKSSQKLGEDQETWADVTLGLKPGEKMAHGRRYAQVGWVKTQFANLKTGKWSPGTSLALLERPVKFLHVHF